ncbi:hypothetical protein U1E44_00445 [Arenibacter sp. GZD96]|uniref:hypothetical protein n=1 Tax=Aurantibrevibacter litoralis TaxID=3106030 RepID=UPI002AFF6456|nr:hypothetical protein [Arenibacter sp. GZD-96]MEA1784547.1 hypothetical protein [Arenibacter sp. GZD-96]
MKRFSIFVSYVFHPLFVPIAGSLVYFKITPKYSPLPVQGGTILPIFILTVIIPIIAFLILKNLGLVRSLFMPEPKERRYPYYIAILLLFMVLFRVIPNNFIIELHYYFLGLVLATMASLLLLFFNFKSSMHVMGIGSLSAYLHLLSIHFEINLIWALSAATLTTGIVASCRLYLKAHNSQEILIGLFIGLVSQLVLVKFWL